MEKAILYIHGKGGNYKESEQYKKNCEGFDIVGVDYEIDYPWKVMNYIKEEYDRLRTQYKHVYIIANSIGAYFSMLTLHNSGVEKALFISPIVDMEKLITNMMQWANVTEEELREAKEIETDFDETLSWEYLTFVRNHPIEWNVLTEVLYADGDNLTSRDTIEQFVESHNARLTIMTNGEHWFHTEEQIAFLNAWMKKAI